MFTELVREDDIDSVTVILSPTAQRRRREVAALSLSLREGVDSGGLPPAARTSRHVTSSFCSIL